MPFWDHSNNSFPLGSTLISPGTTSPSLLSNSLIILKFPSNFNNIAFDSSIDLMITINHIPVKSMVLERINWVVISLSQDIPLLTLGNVGQQIVKIHIDGIKMVEFANEKMIGDQLIKDSESTNTRQYL